MDQEVVRIFSLLPAEFHLPADGTYQELPGGSDRRFFRVADGGRHFVVMHDPLQEQYDEYLAVQKHLWARNLGVPDFLYADPRQRVLVMEDIGDRSLEQAVKAALSRAEVLKYFGKVIEFLVAFQQDGIRGNEHCPPLANRWFDYTVLRWETGYFRTYFLEKHCRIAADRTAALETEFEALAQAALQVPRLLMHRDFHSKNIFLKDGVVRIVDFQGSRPGLCTYDLAALVRDPYIALTVEEGDGLVEYFREVYNARHQEKLTPTVLGAWFRLAALQRLMQALGAYSFLTLVKHKGFLEHVPAALGFLQSTLKQCPQFPLLTKMVLDDVPRALKTNASV
jgi:aminoglycoside/choline kinase family phosphotransferase